MGESGDPGQPFQVDSYQSRAFSVEAGILVDPRYATEHVFAAVLTVLEQTFSFEERAFGQPVTQSEVLAVIQGVAGVVSVVLEGLYVVGEAPALNPLLLANRARRDDSIVPPAIRPAELLILHPDGISLTEMQS